MSDCIVCGLELNKDNHSIPNQTFNILICKPCNNRRLQYIEHEPHTNCRFCFGELTPTRVKAGFCFSCRNKIHNYRQSLKPKQPTMRDFWLVDSIFKLIEVKLKLFEKFGSECACCGEKNFSKLTIDHIKNNGSEERKQLKIGTGISFYRYLARQDLDLIKENYQLLCFNCNCAKGHHGFCPHKLTQNSDKCSFCGDDLLNNQIEFNKKYNHTICKKCILLLSRKREGSTVTDYRKLQLKNNDLKKKDLVLSNYGGQCINCGESDPYLLSIDHINNNGNLERKNGYGAAGICFYRQLIKENYPKDKYQLLCFNCNCSKTMYPDIPPHLIEEYSITDLSIREYLLKIKKEIKKPS